MSDNKREPQTPNAAGDAPPQPQPGGQHFGGQLPQSELARLMDVKVLVTVELGRRRLSIADVLNLQPHSVLEFFKNADEPLDIRVNGRLVARGEAVVMGERYGVRVTEVLQSEHAKLADMENET